MCTIIRKVLFISSGGRERTSNWNAPMCRGWGWLSGEIRTIEFSKFSWRQPSLISNTFCLFVRFDLFVLTYWKYRRCLSPSMNQNTKRQPVIMYEPSVSCAVLVYKSKSINVLSVFFTVLWNYLDLFWNKTG